MDIGDIGKVATRKRINTDVEKLKEKVSRETAKIIKLKVAQDTAYWDLKEKLQQVEGNHERLQQNMVEVQMQHETISGQYQEELRLRPDTLNKLSSSREISEVLQEYSERLKDTLSRCKMDQAALCDAYQRSGQVVREMKQKQLRAGERSSQLVAGLEGKVQIMNDHQNQLVQFFAAFKQQTESEMKDLKEKVVSLSAAEQELTTTINEQNRALDKYKFDLEKKEEINLSLQKDLKQLIAEYNAQGNEARNIIQQKEKDIKELQDSDKNLKEALANQDQYTKSVCDQNNELIEKVAAMEEDHDKAASLIGEMKIKVAEATSLYDELKKEMIILMEERERCLLDITDKEAVIIKHTEEIKILGNEIELKNDDIDKMTLELKKYREENMTQLIVIEELKTAVANERNKSVELKRDYDNYKNTMQLHIEELTSHLKSNQAEIDTKTTELERKSEELVSKLKELDLKNMELFSKKEELDLKNKEIEFKEKELSLKNEEFESLRKAIDLNNKELDSKVQELESKNKELDSKTKELDSKNKELDSKANTITKLMSEMKTGTDIRSKLELTLQRLKQETEREKEIEREKENKMANKIEHLEKSVMDKDESLSKQMSIIMEMRHEKERLHEKIQGMQNTIDNIQKELTGRSKPPQPADLDDNAVMFPPSKDDTALLSPILKKKKEFAVPRVEPKLDNMLYSLFSDSSMEGDTIDSSEVNRRFQAISRGERVSPRPLASLKRRSGVPAIHGGLKMKPSVEQGSISLSQVRDDLKIKDRKFFKNKKAEQKINKEK